MADSVPRLYEGMFLMSQTAGADLGASTEHLREILNRAEAEIVVLRKWDERKMAYEIHGQKRGLYMIAYFKARPTQIANIERDCNLSELVVRSLIISGEHIGETELELARRDESLSMVEVKLRADAEAAAQQQAEGEAGGEAAEAEEAPAGRS